ncbi:MAG TPA: T9SS type A sorting domain-containing protein, partial [Ignavibacteriaceae bacterium]
EVPFPVELSSFTAKLVNDKVKLEWITETEVNNYGFDVERKVNQDEWQRIGFVEGHGNSNSQKIYNFIDDRLIGGSKFNYRLKQIDTDGQFEYSDVIEIENIPMNFALFQNYPNPFNPSTKISFSIPIQERVTIRVFDVLGRQVEELMNDVKSPGYYSIIFNAADLPSATYFYEIRAGSFFETKKMLLIR